MSDEGEKTKDDPPQENQKKKKEHQESRNDEADSTADMMLHSEVAEEIGSSGKSDTEGDSEENVKSKKDDRKLRINVQDFQSPLEKICGESSITSLEDSVSTDPTVAEFLSDADGDSRENVENKKENKKSGNNMEDLRTRFQKICRESSVTSILLIKDSIPTITNIENLLSEADDDSRENVEKKKENQIPRIDGKDVRSPLKKLWRESSITSAPLPIKDPVHTDLTAVNLLSDTDDSWGNVGKKKENQKPRNAAPDSLPLAIKDSVSTLEKQNPPRKEPEEDSYTRRLLSDVETQIGFFRGAIDYNKKNKKYPFVDSKSINKFITDSFQAGASAAYVMNGVKKKKSQQSESMKVFIKDWLQVDDSVEDVMKAVHILKLQYKKRLSEIERKLDCLDPEKNKAFELAHMIWLNTEKPAVETPKTSDYIDGEGECSKKCRNEVEMVKKNPSSTVPLNNKISILRKIIDYKQDYEKYPFNDQVDLINFNKDCVQLDFSVEALLSNIVGFRQEYMEAREARERHGCSFESPDEELFYKLADQIWGLHK